ncbi:MAG: (2Fe-2S)-binding protein [Clostridia bacterium]|nr:(2Fe-2S)-binding protein [Clostridia bacterium]
MLEAINMDMHENYMVCNCKQVSYTDIADALDTNQNFKDVLDAFESVKEVTHCSTGCGGCHDKVLGVISDIMMK